MFDMAEEYYLRLDDHVGFVLKNNLMAMYVDRRLSQEPERMASQQGVGNVEAVTEAVLLGLLYQVGYKDPDPYKYDYDDSAVWITSVAGLQRRFQNETGGP
jgi:hypothetical protein